MSYEDPLAYLRRSKDRREVFCQTLTTTLLVGGTYPRWGTKNALTEQGTVLFNALDRLSRQRRQHIPRSVVSSGAAMSMEALSTCDGTSSSLKSGLVKNPTIGR